MPQKVYLWILKLGVISSFFCTLFVFKTMLFPYITSKQIPFNILMEVLFVFWLAFIIKYPQWSPFRGYSKSWPLNLFLGKKKTEALIENEAGAGKAPEKTERIYSEKSARKNQTEGAFKDAAVLALSPHNLITLGLFVFFIVIIISCFTGIDFNMSFWSNAERMLGVYHILHFLALYLIVITVMRDWRDWLITLFSLSALGLIVALIGLGAPNNYSVLGNTLYASVFMIFSAYIVFMIFFHKDPSAAKSRRFPFAWLMFLALPFFYLQFKRADNTGAYVGVLFGIVTFIFLLGVINKRRLVRAASWAIAALLVLGFVFVFTQNSNQLVAGNHILAQMDFGKNTFQTRLLSWRSAAMDFKNHPVLGTGFGNYAIIFDKFFDAKFFTYTMGETYFDRAHNNIVDIASTTGVLGITAYLFIWAAIIFYLVLAFRRRRISPLEFCAFASLLAAYFVQNLTVFDSFVSYMCFMIIIGYLNWLANTKEDRGNERALLAFGGPKGFADREIFALLGAGIAAILLIYNYAIIPMNTFKGVIAGQIAFSQGDIKTAIALFDEALNNSSPLKRDSRSMFSRSVADQGWNIAKMDKESSGLIISFAIEQGLKNLANNPVDNLMNMELARVYDVAFRAAADKDKKAEYAEKALEYIDRSIASSPQRVPVYFIKTQFLIGQNKVDEAIGVLEHAATISDIFSETYCQLGQIYLIKENSLLSSAASSSAGLVGEKGWENMDKCLNQDGAGNLIVADVVKEAINHYVEKKDMDKVIALYRQIMSFEPRNTQYLITLARLYQEKGDIENAIAAAGQAAVIDPNLKADAEQFIRQLQNGK